MFVIETFVFFDIETTGLPWQEKNQTKITELSFVAVSRKDLIKTNNGDSPAASKLTMVFNPKRPINPKVIAMNGLSNELLQHAPLFKQKIETIVSFLKGLPKPVCLVAHNGNVFDYKILLAEFNDANSFLPTDLLCVDSLVGFRYVLSDKVSSSMPNEISKAISKTLSSNTNISTDIQELLTDDEDVWPVLNVSSEDWEDIDKICDSFSDISCEDVTDSSTIELSVTSSQETKTKNPDKVVSRREVINNAFQHENKPKNKNGYTLLALYHRLTNKDPANHHRAEEDCFMLLQCVIATKFEFIPWADQSCVQLSTLKPLVRKS